jgi:SAM-dependent methyltransferase
MTPSDIERLVKRYEDKLAVHGYSPESLCCGRGGRSEIRFGVMGEPILAKPDSSVLDIGCGFADLFDYLRAKGWRGRYTGVDLVPGLLKVARERHPELDLRQVSGADDLDAVGRHDFVIAVSTMNFKLENNGNEAYIRNFVSRMFHLAEVACMFDFQTTYVDFQSPLAWHTSPIWIMEFANTLTRRLVLRADYMPYEFCMVLYKDTAKSERNVYRAAEAVYTKP